MRSVNKVILIGHLTADPEVKLTESGKSLALMSVATNNVFRGEDGEMNTRVDFHRVIAWQNLAEICGEYLKKGSAVYLEGRIAHHSYTSAEGDKKFVSEIVADTINILSWKKVREGEQTVELEEVGK